MLNAFFSASGTPRVSGLRLLAAGPWYRVDRLRFSDHLQIHYIELPKCPAVGPGAEEATRGGAVGSGGAGGTGGGHPLHSAVLWGKFIGSLGRDEARAIT